MVTWPEPDGEQVLPAGLVADFREQLPPFLRERCGQWIGHDLPGPGLVRHFARDGTECWTLRLHLPPGGMLSSGTLRLLARWVREYALAGRRTSRQGFELVGVDPARLPRLLQEVRAAGLLPGGTGPVLHQVKACVGFLHCQNALVDSPGLARAVAEALLPLGEEGLPAPLRVSVAGCPSDCGGAHGADLGLLGAYRRGPCVRVYAGARAGLGARLGRAGVYLAAHAPEFSEVTEYVTRLVRSWCRGAARGERLGDWLERAGWPAEEEDGR